MSHERKLTHTAAVKARYHAHKPADLCVGCTARLDPAAGDTGTQCRGCADYKMELAKARAA